MRFDRHTLIVALAVTGIIAYLAAYGHAAYVATRDMQALSASEPETIAADDARELAQR